MSRSPLPYGGYQQSPLPAKPNVSPATSMQMKVIRCPSDELALSNYLIVSPRDFDDSIVRYVIVANNKAEKFVFTIKANDALPSRRIGPSGIHRTWASLSLNDDVTVSPFQPEGANIYLGRLDLDVGFKLRADEQKQHQFDANEMSRFFIQAFNNQIFTKGQLLIFDFHGFSLKVTVKNVQVVDFSVIQKGLQGEFLDTSGQHPATFGILTPQASIFWHSDSQLRFGGSSRSSAPPSIIQPNFKFEDMGIGGLGTEFSAIFRRAFASRIYPPSLVEKLGVQHVKGILLFGPPGTGKTLMARQIGKMLNAREPQVVNGPEILNKYVGQSEENIRKLFAEAEKEYKAKGEDSGLHIIIFDELDAICKQRGGRNDGTGVGDSVVNQLLAKMDGVEQLNNILIIGMTNRLDLIDEALLRPGRMEVHMEIGLPDENGRLEILKIHTSKMKQHNIMDEGVDLKELANMTKNFSGAEITGLVKSASSFAFNRHIEVGTLAEVKKDVENMRVTMEDFANAFDEIRPAFGASDEELEQCVQNSIIEFSDSIKKITKNGNLYIEQVKKSERTPLVSILLCGSAGSGKTALAATIAGSSGFPFIKLISPENMVGYSELAKMNAINKIFNDSYKSPLSVIVIDNIERLLDYVPIGPRFSNTVLQTLLVLLKKQPPKGRRLLILATATQRPVLEEMGMIDCFNSRIDVPDITDLQAIRYVSEELGLFDNDSEVDEAIGRMNEVTSSLERRGKKLAIGIKKLIMVIEASRQSGDKIATFVDALIRQGVADAGISDVDRGAEWHHRLEQELVTQIEVPPRMNY